MTCSTRSSRRARPRHRLGKRAARGDGRRRRLETGLPNCQARRHGDTPSAASAQPDSARRRNQCILTRRQNQIRARNCCVKSDFAGPIRHAPIHGREPWFLASLVQRNREQINGYTRKPFLLRIRVNHTDDDSGGRATGAALLLVRSQVRCLRFPPHLTPRPACRCRRSW